MTGKDQLVSDNVVWERGGVARAQRTATLGQRGATVWLTGLPASGKSTLAKALEESLIESGVSAYCLDGDNLRHGLCGDLGFSDEDREENVRRTGHVARILADAGVVAIVALVSPFQASRAAARAMHETEGLPFFEIFVDTPLEECERRDPKGLYAKARAGALDGMTGIDSVYEPAEGADLHFSPPWTRQKPCLRSSACCGARAETWRDGRAHRYGRLAVGVEHEQNPHNSGRQLEANPWADAGRCDSRRRA